MAEIPLFLGLGGLVGYIIAESDQINQLTGQNQYDVTELRDPNSFSRKTRKIIDLVTIQQNINPVGNYKYKIQKYPNEIHIFEKYKSCCDLQTAARDISNQLIDIAREIHRIPEIYFGEFKAGLDDRYDIKVDLGEINYSKNEIREFDRATITEHLSNLLEKNLLTEKEYSELIFLVHQPLKFINYQKLLDLLKHKRNIVWTIDELIAGEKTLIGGQIITLQEAITHKSIIKLNVWAKIEDNRYSEITNFFIFIYSDEKGKEHILNLELGDLIESFMKDIIFYSTKQHQQSMKVAQRMWQLAAYINNQEILNKLYPLFQSDIGILNQIASDIDVLLMMLKKLPDPPMNDMMFEIDEFKFRLSTFNEVHIDEDFIYEIIDTIIDNYDKYGNQLNKENIINNLTYLQDYLLTIVEQYSSKYLKENDINRHQLMLYIDKYRTKNKI